LIAHRLSSGLSEEVSSQRKCLKLRFANVKSRTNPSTCVSVKKKLKFVGVDSIEMAFET
jgi:hypothetical protein